MLALIGPNSVRLYANQRDGFAAAQQVYQDPAIALPFSAVTPPGPTPVAGDEALAALGGRSGAFMARV